MVERRKFTRINVSFPIECKTLSSGNYFYTVSKDLSSGGMKILSNDFLPKSKKLKLILNLIDKALNIKAQVSWCAKERSGQRYLMGLKFLELGTSDKKALTNFLNAVV